MPEEKRGLPWKHPLRYHVEAAKTVRDGGMAETGEPRDSGGNGRAARWQCRSAARSTRREAKASDAMILGGEDSVAAGQMNGGVQYIVRAVPKGRAGGRLERKPRRGGPARLPSALLFFFFWRLVEAKDVASGDAKGYECCRQSEPDNYLCNGQRFTHTAKTIIEGFADQRGVFPGGVFEQSSGIFPSCPQGGVQAFLCEVFGLLTPSGLIAIEASFPLFELLSELGFPTTNLGFEFRHETLKLGVVGVLDVLNQLRVIRAV